MAEGMVSCSTPTMPPSLLRTHCYLLGYAWLQARVHCLNDYQLLELGTLWEKMWPTSCANLHTVLEKAPITDLPHHDHKCFIPLQLHTNIKMHYYYFSPENGTAALSLPSNCTQLLCFSITSSVSFESSSCRPAVIPLCDSINHVQCE